MIEVSAGLSVDIASSIYRGHSIVSLVDSRSLSVFVWLVFIESAVMIGIKLDAKLESD